MYGGVMHRKQDYVSDQFHQMYFEISREEMDDIFAEVYDENADLVNSREEFIIEARKEKLNLKSLMMKLKTLMFIS